MFTVIQFQFVDLAATQSLQLLRPGAAIQMKATEQYFPGAVYYAVQGGAKF